MKEEGLEYPGGRRTTHEWRPPERVILVRSLLRGDRVARLDASLSEPDGVLRLASLPHVPRTACHLLLRAKSRSTTSRL